eukprot:g15114.t1
MMAKRKKRDNKKERDFCKEEEEDGTVVFPAIDVPNEIEDIEDTTCIDANRDELLKAFCSFRHDLDDLFKIQERKETAESFFPNICCKERRDTKLEVCKDPSGKTKREDIIPFALSQGGHYSRHNLYAEVSDALKKRGYLHKGMLGILKGMPRSTARARLQDQMDGFFDELSLCGPRVIDEPGTNGERQLCQLFVPYGHVLKHFYNELKRLPPSTSKSQFLELNERRLGKGMMDRQRKVRTATQITRQLGQTIQMKSMPSDKQPQCKAGPRFGRRELANKKMEFCKGVNHVDLMTPTIKNVALYYLGKDIGKSDIDMLALQDNLRFDVIDNTCDSKLFDADDISIQQVAMNANGNIKDWAAVIKLNTDKDGYLKSEMPKCESAKYLPRTEVTVKVFEDKNGIECCQGSKDVTKCDKSCRIPPFRPRDKQMKKVVTVTGTVYKVKDAVSRRRRLLQRGGAGNCRL